jgi:Glutamate/Leucine/Phenylalanine/Valine dehydrogenase/Glu/Leu/Phe/Val dehydrogenase, dimerisation domain
MKSDPQSNGTIDRIGLGGPNISYLTSPSKDILDYPLPTPNLSNGMATLKSLPLSVTEWHDPMSSSVGWLVVDRRVNGISGGGVFMWHGATMEETRGIAHTMSKKFAICPQPIGGAKGGIRCDLKDPVEREAVLRRFLSEMRTELGQRWVTAGDYGTCDHFVDQTVRQLTGRDMQWALFRLGARDEIKADELSARAFDLYQVDMSSALLPHGSPRPKFKVPFIEASVGYGVVQSIVAAYEKLEPARRKSEMPLKNVRIAVQGAGAVGTGVMLYASRLGAQIVAVSDAEGIVYDSRGLDVETLLSLRARKIASLPAEQRQIAGKLLFRFVPKGKSSRVRLVSHDRAESHMAKAFRYIEPKLAHMLENTPCANVFVPAASRYIWNAMAVEVASVGMWKGASPRLLVAGANNVFGSPVGQGAGLPPSTADSEEILDRMRENRAIYVPDFRANGGTAQLFHAYAAGELNWIFEGADSGVPVLTQQEQQTALQTISTRIREAVHDDLKLCSSSCLDLPFRAEMRVARQLAELS